MSFKFRLFFFIFGILIGILFIKSIFSKEKISNLKKGYIGYFKGHDKVINMLSYNKNLKKQVESHLNLNKTDSLFYENIIRNSDLKILSRKPCFKYLLIPNDSTVISQIALEKCDKNIKLTELKIK
jgi:hypothetical protein